MRCRLTRGLHCKACDAPMLSKDNLDDELCNICMAVVFDYNRDLDTPGEEEVGIEFVPFDEEEHYINEYAE